MSLTLLKEVDLRELAEIESAQLSLSLYLPLEAANGDANRIRLKNVVAEARTLLEERLGEDDERVEQVARELKKLYDHEVFTGTPYPGIAVLADLDRPDELTVYPLWTVPEARVSVSSHPYLTPLIRSQGYPLVTLLCIADGGIRLFRGHYGELSEEKPAPDFPEDITDTMRYEISAGLGNEFFRDRPKAAGLRGIPGAAGDTGAGVVHGEADTQNVEEEFERRYLRQIGEALGRTLKAKEKVLLAGVKEKLVLFRAENPNLPLLKAEIHGNFERGNNAELLNKANRTLKQLYHEEVAGELAQAQELAPEGRSSKLEELREAAGVGRVATLFLNAASDLGEYEMLALQVLRTRGEVKIIDLPSWKDDILGTLRW